MGQRLNIEIKKDDETLANCYYHWSGYTRTSLKLTEHIINIIDKNRELDQDYAVDLLKSTGADFGKDRNAGLIGITEKDIEQTRYWEEARVEIDIQNEQIKFDVYFKIDEEDIKKYPEEYEDYSFEVFPYNPFNFSFEELSKIKETIKTWIEQHNYDFTYENKKYGFIE